MKKTNKIIKIILEELEKTPLVQVACKKAGISRNTFYNWMKENKVFRKQVNESMSLGNGTVNDFAVSNILTGIQNKDFASTRYWLDRRHPDFKKPYRIVIDPNDILLYERMIEEKEQIIRIEKEAEEKSKILDKTKIKEAEEKIKKFQGKWFKKDKPMSRP